MALTYLPFVLATVGVPLAIVTVAVIATRRVHPAQMFGTGLLAVVALGYTIPWDGYLIHVGVWGYGSTLVGRLGVVPYEELLFIASQTLLVGLWTTLVVRPHGGGASVTRRQRAIGVAAGGLIGGLGLIAFSRPGGTYLGAILVWAAPVLALQWGFGWPVLVRARRAVALALVVPTGYLWAVDRVAIELGLWSFSPTRTTGLAIGGLPIEEALFFLVTNVFLVQGLVLFGWVVERELIPSLTDALRTAPSPRQVDSEEP